MRQKGNRMGIRGANAGTNATRTSRIPAALPVGLLFAGVLAAAVNLRAGISSLGPVLADVLSALHMPSSLAGLITAMPGLIFSAMGLCAVPLARRVGLSATITAGSVLTALGLAVRPWTGEIWVFFAMTTLVVTGIAVGNVLIPAWIKRHGGSRTVVLMTMYSAVLGLSGALGPLSALVFHGTDGWRWALFCWSLLAIIQVAVWAVVVLRAGRDTPGGVVAQSKAQGPTHSCERAGAHPTHESGRAAKGGRGVRPGDIGKAGGASKFGAEQPNAEQRADEVPIWRSRTAMLLMVFFGLQSMTAYVQMGWLPQMLKDAGVSASTASVALAMVGALNVVGGLSMPTIIDRTRHMPAYPLAFAVFTGLGYLGVLLAPTAAPLLWALVLGLGGFCFPTAIALIPARTRSSLVTARLSGFVQPIGYLFAAAGPLLVGVLHGHLGNWNGILIGLVVSAALMGAVGMRAAAHTVIDDELAALRGAPSARRGEG